MAPEVFGQYTLQKQIARGGMAEIWLATNRNTGDRVVIKRALPHLADHARAQQMLVHEARMLMLLDHPNIVRIFETDVIGGISYIAMEFIEGSDLHALIRSTRAKGWQLPQVVALRVMHDVCLALGAAHSAVSTEGRSLELVHRDVSPHNVMITRAGQVKLLDFGIVKAPDEHNLTEPGTIKGKFAYMSPEQAAATKLDGRSDLFTAGLVLYELVTGQRAYLHATDAGMFYAALKANIDLTPLMSPTVPEQLRAVIQRALQPNADARFQTAEAMADAIAGCGRLCTQEELARWSTALAAPEGTEMAAAKAASVAPPAEIEKVQRRVDPDPFTIDDQEPLKLKTRNPPVRVEAPEFDEPRGRSDEPTVLPWVLFILIALLTLAIGWRYVGKYLDEAPPEAPAVVPR